MKRSFSALYIIHCLFQSSLGFAFIPSMSLLYPLYFWKMGGPLSAVSQYATIVTFLDTDFLRSSRICIFQTLVQLFPVRWWRSTVHLRSARCRGCVEGLESSSSSSRAAASFYVALIPVCSRSRITWRKSNWRCTQRRGMPVSNAAASWTLSSALCDGSCLHLNFEILKFIFIVGHSMVAAISLCPVEESHSLFGSAIPNIFLVAPYGTPSLLALCISWLLLSVRPEVSAISTFPRFLFLSNGHLLVRAVTFMK